MLHAVEHEHRIQMPREFIEVVGRDNNGPAMFLAQHIVENLALFNVKAEIGFIEKHELTT